MPADWSSYRTNSPRSARWSSRLLFDHLRETSTRCPACPGVRVGGLCPCSARASGSVGHPWAGPHTTATLRLTASRCDGAGATVDHQRDEQGSREKGMEGRGTLPRGWPPSWVVASDPMPAGSVHTTLSLGRVLSTVLVWGIRCSEPSSQIRGAGTFPCSAASIRPIFRLPKTPSNKSQVNTGENVFRVTLDATA